MLDDMVHVMVRHRSIRGPSPVRSHCTQRNDTLVHHLDLEYSLQNYLRAGFTEIDLWVDLRVIFRTRILDRFGRNLVGFFASILEGLFPSRLWA
jgi:hypothetical protein